MKQEARVDREGTAFQAGIGPPFRGTAHAEPLGVQGTITTLDVLRHTVTILRLWGPAFYVRCLRMIASGRRCTFLDALSRDP